MQKYWFEVSPTAEGQTNRMMLTIVSFKTSV